MALMPWHNRVEGRMRCQQRWADLPQVDLLWEFLGQIPVSSHVSSTPGGYGDLESNRARGLGERLLSGSGGAVWVGGGGGVGTVCGPRAPFRSPSQDSLLMAYCAPLPFNDSTETIIASRHGTIIHVHHNPSTSMVSCGTTPRLGPTTF